jgi:hypothetical protein
MPKVTLFEAGTVGVDLKTNPLFLGKKKLHSATNLVFEEGVLKTRPGFRYLPLGCTGIFQGACEFFPKLGLSTASFSDLDGGMAVAVGGKLYFKCGVVKGVEFPCYGNVNLYQAENYLIIQHEESETYWWDGVNPPVKSMGMNEQDFNDPETPFLELETVVPVRDAPNCTGEGSGVALRIRVINSSTSAVVEGALIELRKNGVFAHRGTTGPDGVVTFFPRPRTYIYSVIKVGYDTLEEQIVAVNGEATEVIYDACMPPAIVINGEVEIVVGLSPIAIEATCFSMAQAYVLDGEDEIPTQIKLTLTNTSGGERSIFEVTSGAAITTDKSYPLVVPMGGSVEIIVTGEAALAGELVSVSTQCGDAGLVSVPFMAIPGPGPEPGDICTGLWGPGHDAYPSAMTISGSPLPVTPAVVNRYAKCAWSAGLSSVSYEGDSIWRAYTPTVAAYRSGMFSSGPVGNYYSNTNGSGTLIYTVA